MPQLRLRSTEGKVCFIRRLGSLFAPADSLGLRYGAQIQHIHRLGLPGIQGIVDTFLYASARILQLIGIKLVDISTGIAEALQSLGKGLHGELGHAA